MEKHTYPTAFVIFGGTGDLAEKKLIPALLDLYVNDRLPDQFTVIGTSRKEMSDADYGSFVHNSIDEKGHAHSDERVAAFCSHMRYVPGDFLEGNLYERVKEKLRNADNEIGQCTNKLFYLAVPPRFYGEIFNHLKESNVMQLCDGVESWARLLVEKPFGHDLRTAQALETQLCDLFSEEQIYRIDHYLAKGAIENIIALRFANSILIDSWSNNDIESISLNLHETKDVAMRGSFYDGIGALRDVGQNHMLQMLALLTMDKVNVNDQKSVREGRTKALEALNDTNHTKITRAQYQGFKETAGVAENSETETYFKIDTEINSDLWKGVKISMESGKALDRSITEAIITFKPLSCGGNTTNDGSEYRNTLTITFSPEQKIELTMWVKKPGFSFALEERRFVLSQSDVPESRSPEAYERVLYDCIVGDQTRFVSGAEVLASWKFITPILESFPSLPLSTYTKGSSASEINN